MGTPPWLVGRVGGGGCVVCLAPSTVSWEEVVEDFLPVEGNDAMMGALVLEDCLGLPPTALFGEAVVPPGALSFCHPHANRIYSYIKLTEEGKALRAEVREQLWTSLSLTSSTPTPPNLGQEAGGNEAELGEVRNAIDAVVSDVVDERLNEAVHQNLVEMFDQEVELEFGNPSLNMDMEAEGGNAGVGDDVNREQESAVGSDQASSASLMEGVKRPKASTSSGEGTTEELSSKSKKSLPFACVQCDKSFAHKSSLRWHEKTHREPGDRQVFKCARCEREFSFLSAVKRHLKTVDCTRNSTANYTIIKLKSP